MTPSRRPGYKLMLVTLALALLAAASMFQRALNRQREDPRLGLTSTAPLENAPPVLAFTTVALGGFRGLIANALWIRANDLQNDGKYFEMVQLADWITKLQPRMAQVWIIQAWNMAYNISVKFIEAPDRWRWVKAGIELLRDNALRYCPGEALVYRELAWFFQHKMGQSLDDAHLYYKEQWAKDMTALFGGPRPNFEELANPTTDAARARLRRLREDYKLDPQAMLEVERTYGALEWRLPEAHAIYWASAGLQASRKKDLITLRRALYQSMAMSVLRGRLIAIEPIRFGPDLTKADAAHAAFEKMIEDDTEQREGIRTAHKNWLREVVYLFYGYNRVADAQRWYDTLRRVYPDAVPPNMPLQQYALDRITQNLSGASHDRTKATLEGMIFQHYFNLALDEDDRAAGLELMARQVWKSYQEFNRREALVLPPLEEMKRTVLDLMLDPTNGLPPAAALRLRSKLGLPPPAAAPASPAPQP